MCVPQPQAMGVLGSALSSGQLGPLMTQFGLGQTTAEAAATGSEFTHTCLLGGLVC